MSISDNARKLFDALPPDGSTIGGMKVRDRIAMSAADFRLAKAELKNAGLVGLGRGRGGTIWRNEGAEAPEPEKKKTKEEVAALAREGKVAKQAERREAQVTQARREAIKRFIAAERDIDPEVIEVEFTGAEASPIVFLPRPDLGDSPTSKRGHRINDDVLLREGLA